MKIIHCAPFNIFTKTGGSLYANPVKISHGLIQNGHFVHNFDYRDTSRYLSLFRNKKSGKAKMNAMLLQLIDELRPELILFGHAELVDRATFEQIKAKKIRMAYWYNDIPIQPYFKEIAHFFEAIFTTAGGEFIEDIKKYNKRTFFLPNLVDINVEKYRSFERDDFNNDILFTGRSDSERAALIHFLKSLDPKISKKFLGESKQSVVIGDAYLAEIAASKICLNHNRDFTRHYEWYSSDRLMHILGNGAFCLSTRIVGGEDFFEDKLEYYDSHEELKAKIEYFLANKEERVAKSKWLHARTHALFNAKRVGAYMLDIVDTDTKKLMQYEWFRD